MPSFWKGFGQEFGESFGDTFRQARADRLRREERDEERAYQEERERKVLERAQKAKRNKLIAAIRAASPEARGEYLKGAEQPIPAIGTQSEIAMQTALAQGTGVDTPLWQQSPEWQREQEAIKMDVAQQQLSRAETDVAAGRAIARQEEAARNRRYEMFKEKLERHEALAKLDLGTREKLMQLQARFDDERRGKDFDAATRRIVLNRQYAAAESDESAILGLAAKYGSQGKTKEDTLELISRSYNLNPEVEKRAIAQWDVNDSGRKALDREGLKALAYDAAELAGSTPSILRDAATNQDYAGTPSWDDYKTKLVEQGRDDLANDAMTELRFRIGTLNLSAKRKAEQEDFINRVSNSQALKDLAKEDAKIEAEDISAAKELLSWSEKSKRPSESMSRRRDALFKYMHNSHRVAEGTPIPAGTKVRASGSTGLPYTPRQFELAMAMIVNTDADRVLKSTASREARLEAFDRVVANSYIDVNLGPPIEDGSGRPKFVIVPEQISVTDPETGEMRKTLGARYFIHPDYQPSTSEMKNIIDKISPKGNEENPMKLDDGTEIEVKRND